MFRIVKIGPVQESLAIFFFPLVYSIVDAITEVYGKKNAFLIVVVCYFISLFFSMALMLSCYIPFPEGLENKNCESIFGQGPLIIFAGFISGEHSTGPP